MFIQGSHRIIKSLIDQVVEPEFVRLETMAFVFRHIDITKKRAINQFAIKSIPEIQQGGVQLPLKAAVQIPQFHKDVLYVKATAQETIRQRSPGLYVNSPETWIEHIRKVQAYYLVHIAVNFFWRNSDGSSRTQLPRVPICEKYWNNLFQAEIAQVGNIVLWVFNNLRKGLQ